jgi:predicted transport protein
MPLFKIGNSLEFIKEKTFKLEKEIQELTEQNLSAVLSLDFVKSEFSLHNFRIDTLAFDKESNAFVIIEYKRDKNFSVIDQGYAYLSLMLNNKADFILEYNETQQNTLKRSDVDWSQSRVIFVSPRFTNYQREAINFKDLPIELWEIKRFENNTVSYEPIEKTNATESINTISKKSKEIQVISEELKVFTEEEHVQKSDIEVRELYEVLKERIMAFGDNINLNPRKLYVGFKVDTNTFCDFIFLNKSLKLHLNLKIGELEDSRNIARDVSNVGHWGNGAYEIKLTDQEEIDYVLSLIKQSYKKNKN